MILTKAQALGIIQELRSGELSEEQEIELLKRVWDSERERHGIIPPRKESQKPRGDR